MIMLGEAETVVAGGMENMSQAPHVLVDARCLQISKPQKKERSGKGYGRLSFHEFT